MSPIVKTYADWVWRSSWIGELCCILGLPLIQLIHCYSLWFSPLREFIIAVSQNYHYGFGCIHITIYDTKTFKGGQRVPIIYRSCSLGTCLLFIFRCSWDSRVSFQGTWIGTSIFCFPTRVVRPWPSGLGPQGWSVMEDLEALPRTTQFQNKKGSQKAGVLTPTPWTWSQIPFKQEHICRSIVEKGIGVTLDLRCPSFTKRHSSF